MNRYWSLLLGCCVLVASGAQSQTLSDERQDSVRLGIIGGFDLNMHTANFQTLGNVPNCCPRFERGSGSGPSIGAVLYVPFDRIWSVDVRVAYVSDNATLSADEGTTIIVNNTLVDGTFRHTVVASLASLGYEMFAVYKVVSDLQILAGARASFMMTKSFSQQEEIVQPSSNGTFLDGTRVRNKYSGAIPDAATFDFALLGGVRYVLPMNAKRSVVLAPEILYSYGLSTVAAGQSWMANALRFGLSIQFTLPRSANPRSGGR